MDQTATSCCRDDGSDFDEGTGLCGFAEEDWSSDYARWHEDTPRRPLFQLDCLAVGPPHADIRQECLALYRMQACRTPDREARIRAQLDDAGLFLPMIDVLGLRDYYREGVSARAELMYQIRQNVRYAVFVFKRRYLRARPFRMCPGIKPMFPRHDENYPGHPSYPSGHAAMAYTWAYLFRLNLAERHRELGAALLAAAKEVAENREWAGVHYASDTAAGELLGLQMAAAIAGNGRVGRNEFALLMPGLN